MQTVTAIRSFVFQYPKAIALVTLTGNNTHRNAIEGNLLLIKYRLVTSAFGQLVKELCSYSYCLH